MIPFILVAPSAVLKLLTQATQGSCDYGVLVSAT